MTCGLFDIPCHAQNLLFGWVALVPWWGWAIAGLVVVGIVWKIAGWPGLLALAGAAGYVLGRGDSSKEDDIWPDPDKPAPRRSQKAPPGKRVRTIFDMFKR